MNEIDGLIYALVLWRVCLSCFVTVVLGMLVYQAAPSVALIPAVGVAALGLVIGARWQAKARPSGGGGNSAGPRISPRLVAALWAVPSLAWGFFTSATAVDFGLGLVVYAIHILGWRHVAGSWQLERRIVNEVTAISALSFVAGVAAARVFL